MYLNALVFNGSLKRTFRNPSPISCNLISSSGRVGAMAEVGVGVKSGEDGVTWTSLKFSVAKLIESRYLNSKFICLTTD